MTTAIKTESVHPAAESEGLPSGWAQVALTDIGVLHCGQSPSITTVNTEGFGTPYVTGPDQWDGRELRVDKWTTDPRRIVPSGCVFVTVKGAGVGTIFPGTHSAIGRDVYAFQPAAEIASDFVRRALEFTISEIKRHAAGDIPGLSKEHILGHPIGLPPREEQKRIVAKIDELLKHVNASREHLAKVPKILKGFRQSVLAAACSGRLTEDWRDEHPGTAAATDLLQEIRKSLQRKNSQSNGESFQTEDEEYGNLPDTWVRSSLDQLFSVETGATPLRKNEAYYKNGRVPWVKTGEIQNCDIWAAEERITALAIQETNAKVFPPGTILIAMYGEGKTRGQVGRLRIPAATNQACAALVNPRLKKEMVDYVYYYCLSQYHRLRGKAFGGNQPNLSLGVIKRWGINIPPLEEQREIVRRVKILFRLADKIEKRVEAATKRADRLTQSVLAKAFRGELVPTEAELARREGRDYEPASVLLDRIKAQREITVGSRNGHRRPS